MRAVVLIAGLACLAPAAAQDIPAPVLEAHVDGELRALNVRLGAAAMNGAPPVLWSDQIAVGGADYFRLLLRVEGGPFPPGAELRISPGFGEVPPVALDQIGPEGIWSPVILSARAGLRVVSEQPIGDAVLVLDSIAMEAKAYAQYSIYGRNDLQPVYGPGVPDQFFRHAPAVAILYLIQNGKPATCTGFLIAPDLLLTNEHCVNSAESCASMYATFGYEIGPDRRMRIGPSRTCVDFQPLRVNYDLDASVVRLSSPLGPEYAPVPLDKIAPPEGPLYIIQHPGGQPKQIAYIDCTAAAPDVDGRAPGTDFTHTCDTAGGSSGAPVFDMQARLVGLHHFGFSEDGQGIWTENRAVRAEPLHDWATSLSPTGPAPSDEP